jgi:hypothetical protein
MYSIYDADNSTDACKIASTIAQTFSASHSCAFAQNQGQKDE